MTKYVLKMWWGILLANMSWFLIGATIDISTILTTTISWLSSTFVSQDTTSRDRMLWAIKNTRWQYNKKINLSTKCGDKQKLIEDSPKNKTNESKVTETDEEILDKIMPNEDSITWPLLYIGIGVLQVQDFMYDAKQPGDITKDIFIIATRLSIILMFVVIIIILIMINIFRIVTIRFAVSFAPLLIISMISGGNEKRKEIDILKNFSLKNILIAIFAPVVAVWLMNIGLIVIVIMQWFLQNTDTIQIDNININNTTQWSVMKVDGIMETIIHWDILWQNQWTQVKNTFTNILLIIFTLFILYGIVQALIKFMKGTIWGETIESIGKLSGTLLKSMKIGGLPSINSINYGYDKTKSAITKKLSEKWISLDWSQTASDLRLQQIIDTVVWNPTHLHETQYQNITEYVKKISKQWNINSDDEKNFFEMYKKTVIWHYNKPERRKEKITLWGMKWSENLEAFITKAIQSRKNLPKFEEGESLQNYITKNYYSNKEFFKDLYNRLWWDSTTLTKWEDFRNKAFRREWTP